MEAQHACSIAHGSSVVKSMDIARQTVVQAGARGVVLAQAAMCAMSGRTGKKGRTKSCTPLLSLKVLPVLFLALPLVGFDECQLGTGWCKRLEWMILECCNVTTGVNIRGFLQCLF
jgi:hypothetical protein